MTLTPKKFKCIDVDGMPISEQLKLKAEIEKFKYQVEIQYPNGSTRFIYVIEKGAIESYVKVSKAKILGITEI